MKLINATIRREELRARPFKLFDGGGRYVLVNPNGLEARAAEISLPQH